MQGEFEILKEIILEKSRRLPVFYVPNRGNWGDALIRYATLKFFHNIGLEFEEIRDYQKLFKKDLFFFLRRGLVIYGGGGAWCHLFSNAASVVSKLSQKYQVIVLPSTYELSPSLPRTVLFCRDRYESKRNMPQTVFCHDMAFYLGKEMLLKNSEKKNVKEKGYFFRTDKGSAHKIKIPALNRDLSREGDCWSDIEPFFDEIDQFSEIYTDRLHVAIAACLLKKGVHLYPGSYFKNRAVYLSSMKDYFDRVYFHENFDFKETE
ncbi:MAG: polysaccharide pyruvyl transferase family protein [Candidatus Omnitrophica bacterium]|nr:polysaccharide pyruvyl transferase family protein [Candidatus Omnitrophota bacterium]